MNNADLPKTHNIGKKVENSSKGLLIYKQHLLGELKRKLTKNSQNTQQTTTRW